MRLSLETDQGSDNAGFKNTKSCQRCGLAVRRSECSRNPTGVLEFSDDELSVLDGLDTEGFMHS